ncbi:260_t:CDS:2, partial [Funneliformis geosporum]
MSSTFVLTGENNESYIVVEYTFYTETTAWKDLDNFWALKFLKEAEELDINTFDALMRRRNILKFQAEKERYLRMISELDESIELERSNLAELSSNGGSGEQGDNISSSDSPSSDSYSSISHSSQRRRNRSTPPSRPPPRRNYNLRVQERVNYNVGSSSRRRRRTNTTIRRPRRPSPPQIPGTIGIPPRPLPPQMFLPPIPDIIGIPPQPLPLQLPLPPILPILSPLPQMSLSSSPPPSIPYFFDEEEPPRKRI